MKRFDLPYGRGMISLSLPESRVKAVLESHLHTYRPDLGEEELVNAALESPEGSPRLSQLATIPARFPAGTLSRPCSGRYGRATLRRISRF